MYLEADTSKRKEYNKRYYEKHKKEIYRNQRKWYLANKDRYHALNKKYRDNLPPVVYRWRDGKGIIDYVGRGSLARARIHAHRSKWWTPEHTMSYMICRNEWHSMKMEGIWGELFQPRYNKDGYRRNKG